MSNCIDDFEAMLTGKIEGPKIGVHARATTPERVLKEISDGSEQRPQNTGFHYSWLRSLAQAWDTSWRN